MDIYDANATGVSSVQEANKVNPVGFVVRTYFTMAIGLFLSFISSIIASTFFPHLFYTVEVALGLLVAEIAVVLIFTFAFKKASRGTVVVLFLLYSLFTGLSLSSIFIYYDVKTLYLTFMVTALAFGSMAVYGLITKKDITRFSSFISMGFIALIIASILGFFIGGWFDAFVCGIAVMFFMGVTAYDSAMIKKYFSFASSENELNKLSIYCAMQLYLDFINIFLRLLRIIARVRSND